MLFYGILKFSDWQPMIGCIFISKNNFVQDLNTVNTSKLLMMKINEGFQMGRTGLFPMAECVPRKYVKSLIPSAIVLSGKDPLQMFKPSLHFHK